MLNKFEVIGVGASIGLMVMALYFLNGNFDSPTESATNSGNAAAVVVAGDGSESLNDVLTESSDSQGNVQKLIVDDVVVGIGDEVAVGDTVSVHYIGTLQNGTQFDNSYVKGEPFTFTVGDGQVIDGWEQGVVGMRFGGQRILVIPPDLAYGASGVGPIPANATLVFAIELLAIN